MRTATALLRAADAVTRDGARQSARDELSDPIYRTGEPSPLDRALRRVFDWLMDLVDDTVRIVPGGVAGLVFVLAVVVLAVVLLRLGLGPLRARDLLTDRRRGSRARSAAEYRAEAESLAARGEWKQAVRARFRATIRELEERGVLEPRAGRTAGEIAAEGGGAVPAIAADLADQSELFDEVWYGDRAAGREEYARMAAADDRIRAARLVTAR